jgi:hypothetical protein
MESPPTIPAIPDGQAVQFEKFIQEAKGHYHEALHFGRKIKSDVAEGIKAMLLCGHALNSAKAVAGHGKWLKVLAFHWPDICQQTASRWMRAAEYAHERNLTEYQSQREFLLSNGIISAPETTNSGSPSTPQVITFEAVARISHKIESSRDAVLAWPEDKKQKLKDALKPAHELYETLAKERDAVTV